PRTAIGFFVWIVFKNYFIVLFRGDQFSFGWFFDFLRTFTKLYFIGINIEFSILEFQNKPRQTRKAQWAELEGQLWAEPGHDVQFCYRVFIKCGGGLAA